jgi:hypothetical protein
MSSWPKRAPSTIGRSTGTWVVLSSLLFGRVYEADPVSPPDRQIAFDAGQKAVLTSCVLVNQSVLSRKRKKVGGDKAKHREEAMINVSFAFGFERAFELKVVRYAVLFLVHD